MPPRRFHSAQAAVDADDQIIVAHRLTDKRFRSRRHAAAA
jgi:hypothetical protein